MLTTYLKKLTTGNNTFIVSVNCHILHFFLFNAFVGLAVGRRAQDDATDQWNAAFCFQLLLLRHWHCTWL